MLSKEFINAMQGISNYETWYSETLNGVYEGSGFIGISLKSRGHGCLRLENKYKPYSKNYALTLRNMQATDWVKVKEK